MTRHDEPIIGWNPQINLFDPTKAHSFPNYVPEIDGNEKVLLGETWVRIDDEKVWNEWFGLHNVEHSPCSFGS